MSLPGKSIIALSLSVFLALTSTGLSFAVWDTQAQVTASSSAATTQLSVTGLSGLTYQYQTGAQSTVAQVTIANQGTSPLDYSFGIGTATGPLAPRIAVTLWVKPTGACTTTAPSSEATSGTLAAAPALPSGAESGAAGTSLNLCILTTLTGALAQTPPGSISPTFTVTGTVGANWSVTGTTTVTQTVGVVFSAPGTPVLLYAAGAPNSSLSFVWAPAVGNATVTGYEIWRDGSRVAAVGANLLSYTDRDSKLKNNTAYTYTVRVRYGGDDGTGLASGAMTATTGKSTSSAPWYFVVNPNSGRCIDVPGANSANGTGLVLGDCTLPGNASQRWQFEVQSDDTIAVLAGYTASYWTVESDTNPVAAIWTWSNVNRRKWQVVPLGTDGSYHFVNVASGKCLAALDAATANGTMLTVETCGSSAGQTFMLTRVP